MQDGETTTTTTTEDNPSLYSRFRRLYAVDPITGELKDRRAYYIAQWTLAGGLAGLAVGARIGGTVGGVEHIEQSAVITHVEVHRTTTHAKRKYMDRVFMKGMRNGAKFSWRASLFAGLYGTVAVLMCEKYPNWPGLSFLGAGTLTGAVYQALGGWRNAVAGGVVGAALSLPIAAFIGGAVMAFPEERDNFPFFGALLAPMVPRPPPGIKSKDVHKVI